MAAVARQHLPFLATVLGQPWLCWAPPELPQHPAEAGLQARVLLQWAKQKGRSSSCWQRQGCLGEDGRGKGKVK